MAFWNKKKDDGLGLDDKSSPDMDLGLPPLDSDSHGGGGSDPFGSGFNNQGMMQHPNPKTDAFSEQRPDPFVSQHQSFQAGNPPGSSPEDLKRDIEMILAKLDAVKAQLDAVSQRVIKIERIADEESRKQEKKVW